MSLAVVESADLVLEHAEFKARLLMLEAEAGRTVEHALDLSQQVQSITEWVLFRNCRHHINNLMSNLTPDVHTSSNLAHHSDNSLDGQ